MQPYQIKDLELVSAADAAYIILMYPDLTEGLERLADGHAQEREMQLKLDAEALNAMTVAALSTFDRLQKQNLVVQVCVGQ
jgi:hypothetical protein